MCELKGGGGEATDWAGGVRTWLECGGRGWDGMNYEEEWREERRGGLYRR